MLKLVITTILSIRVSGIDFLRAVRIVGTSLLETRKASSFAILCAHYSSRDVSDNVPRDRRVATRAARCAAVQTIGGPSIILTDTYVRQTYV